jgi:LmbE family N-acetylglucosaminyl deacetylase
VKKILIIAAHPDDEILGCGGTVARLVREGDSASLLILGEGITSRDDKRNVGKRKSELADLRSHIFKANKAIGVKDIIVDSLPDNRFDSLPLLDIVKVIEEQIRRVKPDIVFTHDSNDLNIDHRLVHDAVITATRPLPGGTVKEVYLFEVPSSTGWNYPHVFQPNVFINIESTLKDKLKAFEAYTSEIRPFPHPRSLEGIKISASYWGMQSGNSYAEAFKLARLLK